MSDGHSLQLYFVDGKPDGMLTATVFGWTGHVLKFPRLQIKDALARPEIANTGAYILLGSNDGIDTAYIGESESVRKRLIDHESKKDWWEEAIVITSSDNSLHKAHVQFIESRLVEIAKSVGHTPLANQTTPARPSLSEADISNMEVFLATLNMVLPAIRVDMFIQKKRGKKIWPTAQALSPHTEFALNAKKAGISARAIVNGNEFIVLDGSSSQTKWVGKYITNYKKLQSKLIENGVITQNEKHGVFSENYAFSSPSAAAAVILGRSSNGRIEWKVKGTNKTYSDWETENTNKEETLK